jgi:tRNA-Thr(GGU) m(6)t(6)A37 methyltransferase TsaA
MPNMTGMTDDRWTVHPVGHVSSTLSDLAAAPRQGDEGAPQAWITLTDDAGPAAADVRAGDRLVILTWLHLADREVLSVHPRSDESLPLTGVFSTRSPDRPNPIGLHPVTVLGVEDGRLRVEPLEAIDGTPVIDIKVALRSDG